MGDNYQTKVDDTAKKGEIYDVLQQCTTCGQLMFYHAEGVCKRSDTESDLNFDDDAIEELKLEINKDVKKKINEVGSMDVMMKMMDNQQKIFEKMLEDRSGIGSRRPLQVTNVKQPPLWKKQKFADFKEQVTNWKNHNTGDDYSKYQDFITELQKNAYIKGLEEYMSSIVIPSTKNAQNVDAVLKLLEEK